MVYCKENTLNSLNWVIYGFFSSSSKCDIIFSSKLPRGNMDFEGKTYYVSKQGYYTRDERVGGKRVTILLHRVIWEKHNHKIPPGFHIHHKDENKLNNSIDNLECIPQPKHASLHRKEEWVNGTLSYLVKGQKKWLSTEDGQLKKSSSVKNGWKTRKSVSKSCMRCGTSFETKAPQRKWCSRSCLFKNWWHKETS